MRHLLHVLLAALAAALAAGQEAAIPAGNFTFDFGGTPWSAPMEQAQRLAAIAGLNNTVQSLQADPLKLGAILLESMRLNQTEAVLRSFGEAVAAVNSSDRGALFKLEQLGKVAAYTTWLADPDAVASTFNGTVRPPAVPRSDIVKFADAPLVNVSQGLLGTSIPQVFFAALISSTPTCWNVGSSFGPNTFSTVDGYILRCGGRIGPVLAAYVRELGLLVPGTGYMTSLFQVQDALEPLLDLRDSTASRIMNRALQVYGSGNRTISALYDTP